MNTTSKAIEAIIASLQIVENRFVIFHKEHVAICVFIKKAIELELISQDRLLQIINEKIINLGFLCYKQHIQNPRYSYPDHVISPHALAYALKKNCFGAKKELIQYDHGESENEFIRLYCPENFPQQLLDQLLTEPKGRKGLLGSTNLGPCSCACC